MPLLFETTQQTTDCKSRSTQVPDPGRLCPATRLWIVLDCSTPSYCNALGRTTWASGTRSVNLALTYDSRIRVVSTREEDYYDQLSRIHTSCRPGGTCLL